MNQAETRRERPHFDFFLLIVTYALMILGVLFISVATFDPNVSLDVPLLNRIINSNSGSWQATFVIASPAVIWFLVSIPYEHFRSYARLYYVVILGLLIVVTVMSTAIRDVKSWMTIGLGRMIQPSEFVKITMILMLARLLSASEKPMTRAGETIRIFGVAAVPMAVTLVQGEAGSVIVMIAIFYLMLYFAGVDWKWLLGLALVGLVLVVSVLAYGLLSGSENYRLLRILSFLDPTKYDKDAGYQILNSQLAIGAGGMSGVGFFIPGSLSQLKFVPENWTDFVFSTVGEAVGFIGSTVIVVLYLILLARMLYLSRYTYDKFGRLIIIGVMSMMFIHVFQNIAMTVGLMPITGIPLPFISYGGSNLLTNLIGVSLVLNVTLHRGSAMPAKMARVRLPQVNKKKTLKERLRGKRITTVS